MIHTLLATRYTFYRPIQDTARPHALRTASVTPVMPFPPLEGRVATLPSAFDLAPHAEHVVQNLVNSGVLCAHEEPHDFA